MIELSFAADIAAAVAEAEALCARVRSALAALPDSSDRFALELLCREALANAVEHGSGLDGSKRVHFELRIRGGLAAGRVSDEGRGFRRVPESGRRAEALLEHGNGIVIMKRYSDRLRFEDEGRTVVFERRIDEGSQA
ncbi:MAG TPA: ATP-binding protein [Rectinemataceae bacterium]|nr:ATP-binding protein [Rectinemataceae bacterium]